MATFKSLKHCFIIAVSSAWSLPILAASVASNPALSESYVTVMNGAASTGISIPLSSRGTSTFYITAQLGDIQPKRFMVDTGSGYTTINEESLAQLKEKGQAVFVKNIGGILADGSERIVPIWRVNSIALNDSCVLNNVEVAVFPGKTRQLLGVSALKKAGAVTLSFDPPMLTLKEC